MLSRVAILFLVLIISLTACKQKNSTIKSQNQETDSNFIDSSVIAILSFDTTYYWIFKQGKAVELTVEDLRKIDTTLNNCIKNYNSYLEKQYTEFHTKQPKNTIEKNNSTIDLKRYKRQYIASMNEKGEKEVWVNCFCNHWNKDWKKEIIDVMDGGNCYFNLKINLSTGKYYELMVNGDA